MRPGNVTRAQYSSGSSLNDEFEAMPRGEEGGLGGLVDAVAGDTARGDGMVDASDCGQNYGCTSSNSLESRDLGVLQGGCESNHARHVFAVIGEVVLGQAASTSECKRTSRFKA